MKQILSMVGLALAAAGALAKLPPLDDAAKAKAAEAAAKQAWQAKVDAYLLCKAQDRAAAAYKKNAGSRPNPAKPVAAALPASAAAGPGAGAGTPLAAAAPAPCADPGPFAYNPPEQKPLESAGAHSPSATAASPPSAKPQAAQMAPAKK